MLCKILVLRPGVELVMPALGARSLNHQIAREDPALKFLKLFLMSASPSGRLFFLPSCPYITAFFLWGWGSGWEAILVKSLSENKNLNCHVDTRLV